jgi:Fe-S-cluster containining protein
MSEPAAPPQTLAADLELEIGGRTLAVRLPVPAGPTTLGGLLPALRVLMAGLTGVAVEVAAEAGRQVSCRAGCGACCRQLVPIAGAEAHQLAGLIAALPPARREIVVARFGAARTRLEEAGLWSELARMAEISDPEAATALGLAYFALQIACPFLDAESCSIHPDRPLACREYLVSSDPVHCADPGGRGVAPIKLDRRLATAVARTGTGRGPRYVALTALFDWVARHPESPAGRDAALILGEVLSHLTGSEVSAATPDGPAR